MNITELLTDPTLQTVLLGTACIGAVSGGLGCFAYLRKQSLIGDVVAHSSLLGIMIFFLASYWVTGEGNKSLWILIPGAIVSGVVALLFNNWLSSHPRVREDSSLGIILAIFFGSGILILRWVQRTNPPISGRRGLDGYIFGQAASMTQSDVVMVASMGMVAAILLFVFWKELKAYTFDPLFTQSIGRGGFKIDLLLIVLLVIGIVVGIQSIGVVLMIAMLVTPAAAARQWTNSLLGMVCLAALFGATSGIAGSVISATTAKMPTGPVIVLCSIVIFVFSLFFSSSRGILFTWKPGKTAGRIEANTASSSVAKDSASDSWNKESR